MKKIYGNLSAARLACSAGVFFARANVLLAKAHVETRNRNSETRHTNGIHDFIRLTNQTFYIRESYITPVDSNDWSFGGLTANGLSILRPSNILIIW